MKHTDADHPDFALLQRAEREIHDLALRYSSIFSISCYFGLFFYLEMLSLVFLFHALVEAQFGLTVLGRSNKKHPVFVIFSIFINDAKDKQSMCFFIFFHLNHRCKGLTMWRGKAMNRRGANRCSGRLSSFLSFLKKIV